MYSARSTSRGSALLQGGAHPGPQVTRAADEHGQRQRRRVVGLLGLCANLMLAGWQSTLVLLLAVPHALRIQASAKMEWGTPYGVFYAWVHGRP